METAARLDVLGRVAAFAGLKAQALAAVAAPLVERTLTPGQVLMRQGDPGDALWIITSGVVEVFIHRPSGRELLARVPSVHILGEMALVSGSPRVADVVAAEEGTALVLARDDFERVAAAFPDVLSVLTEIAAQRLGNAAKEGVADKIVEGYRVLRPVGRGATAVVYEAEEVANGRRTALKMLSHRLCRDRAAMQWFDYEARILDEVAHEGIAVCYGRRQAYGTRFLAIEYIDGASTHEIVRRVGRMSVADALAVAGSVAAALAHVHARGVVHGDIKPANVMVDLAGRVVLTDFGIASYVLPPDDGESAAIDAPRVRGTPHYMAPELFVGAKPTPSSDLYALGCVLYELLEGHAAFGAQSLGLLVMTKRDFRTPDAEEMRPDLPRGVRELIGSLLDPDAARRPSSATELGLPVGRVAPAVVAEAVRLRDAARAVPA